MIMIILKIAQFFPNFWEIFKIVFQSFYALYFSNYKISSCIKFLHKNFGGISTRLPPTFPTPLKLLNMLNYRLTIVKF